MALAIIAVACLAVTATDDDTRRLFFGHWRSRHLGIAICAFYLGMLCLAYGISRRVVYRTLLVTLIAMATVGLIELAGLLKGLLGLFAASHPPQEVDL